MLFGKPLPFVSKFITMLNVEIKGYKPYLELSAAQSVWLSFCIMGILITDSICWSRFKRSSVVGYDTAALSWMFRTSKIPWEFLPHMSVRAILRRYDIKKAYITIDDSEKKRSKSTKNIAYVHKVKDKSSGGFTMGQSLVFLVLVTPQITIPVGFAFYMPDPDLSAWYKQNKKLKKQGIPPKERPARPVKNENYPTKQEIALKLLDEFKRYHPDIKIKCILAENQNIRTRNKEYSVKEYFSKHQGVPQIIKIRGDKEKSAIIGSARLHVTSHGKKRFIIALKYEGEEEYRYLVASNLTF